VIFVGIDWAEAHHDVCVLHPDGQILSKGRVPDGIEGVSRLHAMLAEQAEDPTDVVVGIEIDRGLMVQALVAVGYRVYAINPLASSRYRDRHATSGAKSDPGDAKVLADLVRTDRHNHREVAGDTELAEAIKVLARTHQSLVWSRQRQANQLRNTLREYYPGALLALKDLASIESCSILAMAPTPERARRLTYAKIRRSLAASGRKRNLDRRAREIYEALRGPQLEAPPVVAEAYGEAAGSLVVLIDSLAHQITRLEEQLAQRFEGHPDAEILSSLPGLGSVLGARCSRSSGTTRPATQMLGPAGATRGPPRSRKRRERGSSCSLVWPATAGWRTLATCGRSRRWAPQSALAATTTHDVLEGPPITRLFARWPTAWWGSCTDASRIDSLTGKASLGRPRSALPLDELDPWDV
jgi:transposase